MQYTVPTMELAAKYGVPYVDVNKAAAVPNADFHDLSHLVEPGRVLWQRQLAKALAPLLKGAGTSAGAGTTRAVAAR